MPDAEPCVVDASVFVDVAIRRRGWGGVAAALAGRSMHAPAHVDVEVLSAIARLHRAQVLSRAEATTALDRFAAAPVLRHDLPALLGGAWALSAQMRVTDALYVELASQLGLRVLTSDARLARASDLVTLVE